MMKNFREKIRQIQASYSVMLQSPCGNEREIVSFTHKKELNVIFSIINEIDKELDNLDNEFSDANPLTDILTIKPNSIDYLNQILNFESTAQIADIIEENILNILLNNNTFAEQNNLTTEVKFLFQHANVLVSLLPQTLSDYIKILKSKADENKLSRLNPKIEKLLEPSLSFRDESKSNILEKLYEKAKGLDKFLLDKTFRYSNNELLPIELADIRNLDDFYGYNEVRRQFDSHFDRFIDNIANLPLLITSLPGLGKTHLTIANVIAKKELVLILSEPSELEQGLEKLLEKLRKHKNHKFVIFFDDIDARKIDWYYFRTNVGGSFILPPNVNIIIASNYHFPANIASRGTSVKFPMFDEILCQEMVFDFLLESGMKKPPNNLVSVIAADYVEKFGQKAFDELSPRTLVHYLNQYNNNVDKRKAMLDMSKSELITRPDSQMFFDLNIKLLKDLYGEGAIEAMRKEKLEEI